MLSLRRFLTLRGLLLLTRHDASRAAIDLLQRAWAEDGMIILPVDPVAIANRLGIDVIETVLDPTISGAIVREPGDDPVIYLAEQDSDNRKRFSCAHELGHFVEREEDEEFAYVDLRGPVASQGRDPAERFANAFAAELLMPKRAVEHLCQDGATISGLAAQFGVSTEAMGYRLDNLRVRVAG